MTILDKILRSRAADYTYEPIARGPDGLLHVPIQVESKYISILLRSMKITDARRLWNKFHPVVHSYVSIPHRDGIQAEFQVVTSPAELLKLDAGHLDRVITLNQPLLGPTPYRGGDLTLKLALYSVKSSDLAKPFIGVLETMATAAGVSFVSVAKPFVEPLKKGLELLTGSTELRLEIGLSTSFRKPETGYFFVMRAERGAVKAADVTIAQDFRLVNNKNQAISTYPYFVFSIEVSDSREDWFLIPEIADIHKQLRLAVRKDKRADVDELFLTFKRIVLTSPDLLEKDAHKLVREVEAELTKVLPASLTSAASREIRPLRSIELY